MAKKFVPKNDVEGEWLWSLQIHDGKTEAEAIDIILKNRKTKKANKSALKKANFPFLP
jgi:hypothetical protein